MTTTLIPAPFGAFAADRLVRDLWARPAAPVARSGHAPAADVYRDGDDLVARFDLPGVDPERDVTVELEGRRLVVRGERRDQRVVEVPADAEAAEGETEAAEEARAESVEKPAGRRIREVRFGEFRRTVTLPKIADADAVRASYDAGVLTVTVAGVFAGRAPQRIEVTRAA
ncbi:Hsp20/alpha crystallin family protein [Cellulosimicrobium cellulans]|uniref:Hsp20/alpha crystallin family protein n=1 Tax=Cellulosimicrobium cellulans TaxID=1710 RepID=UPI000848671F|nr:Hsp20/alpha crystallin family protein [Cellulosimicrobium cellulans]